MEKKKNVKQTLRRHSSAHRNTFSVLRSGLAHPDPRADAQMQASFRPTHPLPSGRDSRSMGSHAQQEVVHVSYQLPFCLSRACCVTIMSLLAHPRSPLPHPFCLTSFFCCSTLLSPSSPAAHADTLLGFSTLSRRNTPSTHRYLPLSISILIISPLNSQTRVRLLLSFCFPRQARKALEEAAAVAFSPSSLPALSEEQQPSAQPPPRTVKKRPAEVKTQRSETSASSLSHHIRSFSLASSLGPLRSLFLAVSHASACAGPAVAERRGFLMLVLLAISSPPLHQTWQRERAKCSYLLRSLPRSCTALSPLPTLRACLCVCVLCSFATRLDFFLCVAL